MTLLKKINAKVKSELNSGFGTNSNNYGGRFINKNGKANVEKKGLNFLVRTSWYHTMIEMPTWKFLSILLSFYISINLLFAILYFSIGIENLNGINASDSFWNQFGKAYFFSTQTFTTVGYGHISPNSFLTSALSAIEALIGLLSFAIATGLFFGRFSKPTAFLKFSENAIIAPYKDGKALMFRIAPYKNTNFTDAEAKITLGLSVNENEQPVNKFYTLDLEMNKINLLTLSWTLVHPISENSPLFNLTKDDYNTITGEIIVFIKTFDEMFSTKVSINTSYTFKEIVFGAKFKPMFSKSDDNSRTILHLNRLNEYEKVDLF